MIGFYAFLKGLGALATSDMLRSAFNIFSLFIGEIIHDLRVCSNVKYELGCCSVESLIKATGDTSSSSSLSELRDALVEIKHLSNI